jgi:peptidoglycan/LPS O-acetylase OafA/YrhL
VPWELKCYVALTGLALFGVTRRRKTFLAITLLTCPALWALDIYTGTPSPGVSLFVGFFAGVAIFKFRDAISWDWRLACASGALMLLLLYFPKGDYAAGFPAAYLTVYLGLTNPRKIAPFRNADYSYGLYLYGYAIQQAVARIFPWSHHWYINLAIAVPLAAAFAALSWTLVEKPSLRLRRYLPFLEVLAKKPMQPAESSASPSA